MNYNALNFGEGRVYDHSYGRKSPFTDGTGSAWQVYPSGGVDVGYNGVSYSYGKSPVINWIGSDDWVDNAHYIYLDGDVIGGDTNIDDSYGFIRINLSIITEK